MFENLVNWLGAWWEAIQQVVQEAWDWGKVSWAWLVGVIVGLLSLVGDFWDWFTDQLDSVASQVQAAVLPDAGVAFSGTTEILGQANVFFPVEEGFAIMALLVAILLITVGIRVLRWVKGLIVA